MFIIARIETFAFRAPIANPVVTSFGSIPDRVSVVVRVEDTDGAHGWGEVWCNFPSYGAEHRALVLARSVAPLAIGLAVEDPASVWRDLTARSHILAVQSGDVGPFAAALAGLDTALWDLKARKAAIPLARLLGADVKGIPVYASGLNPGDGPETVARTRAEGFSAFKQKIGFAENLDVSNLRRIRAGMAPGERLMADVNQGWDAAEALRMAPILAEFDLAWLEEPIPADRPDAEFRALHNAYTAPLAGGENLRGQELLAGASNPWLGVLQPDIGKWGGISGCFAVGQAALEAEKLFCPHWLSGGIGLLASAHLLAAVGGPGLLEVDCNPNPLRTLLAQPFPVLEDSRFTLSDAPGIGVEPDLAAARDFRAARHETR